MISGMGLGAGAASMGGMEAVAKKTSALTATALPTVFDAIAAHKMDQQAFGLTMKRAGEKPRPAEDMGAATSMFKYCGTEVNGSALSFFLTSWVHRLWAGKAMALTAKSLL